MTRVQEEGFIRSVRWVEPEAALSPNRQLAAIKLLHELAFKKDCQIFMATHSPILLAIPGARILQLSENGIEEVEYQDTDLYRTYWAFIKNPQAFVDRLSLVIQTEARSLTT